MRMPKTRGVLVRQHPSRKNVPLALSVTPPSKRAEARRSGDAEDPSSRGAPTPRGSEPRAPSIDRSAGVVTSKLATYRQPPLRPPFGHGGAASDLDFTRTRCALGPSSEPLFAALAGPHAVCRLLQSK
jgi:hypothetical protein